MVDCPTQGHVSMSRQDMSQVSLSNSKEFVANKMSLPPVRHLDQHQDQADDCKETNRTMHQDWSGPHDAEDPHNWGIVKRIYHATVPGLLGFTVTFGTSIYTPATQDVVTTFRTSRTIAILGLTLYTLGLAVGPTFIAPLSERFGRRIVYLVCVPIFMLFTLGAGLSRSLASLFVCRFFAGIMGSPPLAVGAGSIADIFLPHKRAPVTSIFLMAPFLGPALGPIIGGIVAQHKPWRWTQWCIEFITLAVFTMVLFTSETYKPVILARRAQGPQKAILVTQSSKVPFAQRIVRPLHMLFTEPIVFFLSIYTAFVFAVLFAFFAAFPYVFMRPPYHFSISQSGLTFIGVGIGVIMAALTNIAIDRKFYQKQYRDAVAAGARNAQPEHRLYSAMVGSFGVTIGLFWFAWTAATGAHWAVLVVAAIPFAWGNLSLFNSAGMYMVDVYGPLNASSALAANGILRYSLGAVFPLFTVQMYEILGIGWATSLLGFLSLLMLPIPWVLFKWGPAIRKHSRYPVTM